jgi:hypothetical protein
MAAALCSDVIRSGNTINLGDGLPPQEIGGLNIAYYVIEPTAAITANSNPIILVAAKVLVVYGKLSTQNEVILKAERVFYIKSQVFGARGTHPLAEEVYACADAIELVQKLEELELPFLKPGT